MPPNSPPRTDTIQRRAWLAVSLVVAVALVGIRLPLRTFHSLFHGNVNHTSPNHSRLRELEQQLPERRIEPATAASVGRSIALSLLALIPPYWAALAVIRRGMHGVFRTPAIRAFQMALALGTGLGLSSGTYFLWLVLIGTPQVPFFVADLLIWTLLTFVLQRTAVEIHPIRPTGRSTVFGLSRAVIWSFAVILLVAAAGLLGETLASPDGGWDARAIWNLRARLLVRSGDDWRQAFAGTFDHTDYPLLVSASLARWWTFLGSDAAWPGACIGIAFTLAVVGLLMTFVGASRGWNLGLLAGIVLLGTVRFLRCGAAQYADVPLALFILGTIALLVLYDEQRRRQVLEQLRGLPALAGLMAGLAAWTKNEGLLFLAATLTIRGTMEWKRGGAWQAIRVCGCLLAGATPMLIVLVIFKVQVPVANDLIATQGWRESTMRILDPVRHLTIWRGTISGALQVVQAFTVVIPLCFLLLGRHRRAPSDSSPWRFITAMTGLMLAGYYVAYLTTPYELNWHLSTSLDRLVVQVWPMTLLAIFLHLRSPGESFSSDQGAPALLYRRTVSAPYRGPVHSTPSQKQCKVNPG